ncbi:hypothetical protein [Aeromonas caviae]|uniref:hypothetical protein n=1 Tax=Aeromonas caviae TaxID=648 RepID=UPI0029DA7A17|nr:hypothetical protein [Aeromonas caviae]MDX7949394.1 hypothetical protein [Aeromonas caviae]
MSIRSNSRDLTLATTDLDKSACALNTLSRLLSHSVDWERKNRVDHEEFIFGLADLLSALAKGLETTSCQISEFNDKLAGGAS